MEKRDILIAYRVRHVRSGEEIELCGEFPDLEYFKRFRVREEERGWRVLPGSIEILQKAKPASRAENED